MWRHAPEAWAEIWAKSVSWVLASKEEGWLSGLAEIRPVVCGWVSRVVVGGVQMEKSASKDCVSLALGRCTFNSKVIKSFVPELRNRKCFLCFGIPMLSICALWTLWTFCLPVWIFYVYFKYPYHGCVTVGVFYSPRWQGNKNRGDALIVQYYLL